MKKAMNSSVSLQQVPLGLVDLASLRMRMSPKFPHRRRDEGGSVGVMGRPHEVANLVEGVVAGRHKHLQRTLTHSRGSASTYGTIYVLFHVFFS